MHSKKNIKKQIIHLVIKKLWEHFVIVSKYRIRFNIVEGENRILKADNLIFVDGDLAVYIYYIHVQKNIRKNALLYEKKNENVFVIF